MRKWVLIEVENQNINEPDTYNSYAEAYNEMKNRYGTYTVRFGIQKCHTLVNDGEEASIGAYNASIQTNTYNVDWKIYRLNLHLLRKRRYKKWQTLESQRDAE